MKIRQGKPADANEILNLLKTTPQLHGIQSEQIYSKEYVMDFIKDKKLGLVLVAEENNRVIGFVLAEIWVKKKYSFLSDIAVVPEHRSKGVGKRLYMAYENYCRKKRMNIIVELVQTGNKIMQSFMEKSGFKRGYPFYFYEKVLK